MKEEDRVLIVMPVMNLWDRYTIHCMESLWAADPFERASVVVVDNGSTDQTVERAKDFGNRKMPGRVHVIHNDANRGCAAGWNQGVQWGMENGFDRFLIINNDILLSPGTISHLVERMNREPKVVLASAVDVSKEVRFPQEVLDQGSAVNAKETSEAPHPNFSCFMISRECVETVGMFDEAFFPAYFEDNDYHYRIKLAFGDGAAIACLPAVFYHFGSRTQNESDVKPVVMGSAFEANRAYFARKWGGEPGREQFSKPFNNQGASIKDVTRK